MALLQDKYKFWYYDEFPSGWRVATKEDFADIKTCFAHEKPFLLLPDDISDRYECYRVKNNFSVDKISHWLDNGRIFVKD